jgi:hypothetical protein
MNKPNIHPAFFLQLNFLPQSSLFFMNEYSIKKWQVPIVEPAVVCLSD